MTKLPRRCAHRVRCRKHRTQYSTRHTQTRHTPAMSLVIYRNDVVPLGCEGRAEEVERGSIVQPPVETQHFQGVALSDRAAKRRRGHGCRCIHGDEAYRAGEEVGQG